ncbi:hypothetical protein SAMN04487965_0699 [Microbulbifer donghaiensis]|uniref:Uncharacterized protein n=1 Tax=Microbulbifer donghaiensis TaxID=494016 RepID=A0A1M4WIU7_9GAMM|nr:hypothetical protein [Microbulbifer donghaiensis]SHE80993.1 hypothetical protein SAMN04487965_0699 [Microbulbifer donghaiensis]
MNDAMPANLVAAADMEHQRLRCWPRTLLLANIAAIFFIPTRRDGRWRARPEAVALLVAFVAAGAVMNWMYAKVGYVRLPGVPQLVFWLPVVLWILAKFHRDAFSGAFKYYVFCYLVIVGTFLVVDTSDLIRYLLGDHRPLHLN